MTIDLSDAEVKQKFASYLLEEMRNNSLDIPKMTSLVHLGEKQLKRYLPGKTYDPPKKISEDMYSRLLKAVKKTNEDFKEYLYQSITCVQETNSNNSIQSTATATSTTVTKNYNDNSVDMSGSTFQGDINFNRN